MKTGPWVQHPADLSGDGKQLIPQQVLPGNRWITPTLFSKAAALSEFEVNGRVAEEDVVASAQRNLEPRHDIPINERANSSQHYMHTRNDCLRGVWT